MQRTARGGCAVRGALQNAGVNTRKWGTLEEKQGPSNGKFPAFASSCREDEEKSRRKPKEGAEKVRRMGDEHNLGRPNGRNAAGEQRKPGA